MLGVPETGKTKSSDEIFIFSDGGVQYAPNRTEDTTAAVISKNSNLDDLKYENGEMVPKTQADYDAELLAERERMEQDIVDYLENYMHVIAKQKGYDSYQVMIGWSRSSIAYIATEATQMQQLADAIWTYILTNSQSFIENGVPTLEDVKLAHPKWEDFTPQP